MKTCSRCKQELPRDMFYRERKAPDGLYRWCKPCRRASLLAAVAYLDGDSSPRRRRPSCNAERTNR